MIPNLIHESLLLFFVVMANNLGYNFLIFLAHCISLLEVQIFIIFSFRSSILNADYDCFFVLIYFIFK